MDPKVLEEIRKRLGYISTPFGDFYTNEITDNTRGDFTLSIIGSKGDDGLLRAVDKKLNLEGKISHQDGNTVEYVACNTQYFKVVSDTFWDNWNPVNQKGTHHDEIYLHILNTIKSLAEPGSKIMVIGCGAGALLERIAKKGYDVIGIDPNEKNVKTAQSKGLQVIPGRIEDIPQGINPDILIEPGVLSAWVTTKQYAEKVLGHLIGSVKVGGFFIQAPYSRSFITSSDLRNHGVEVLNMSVPENLFTFQYPKQYYVGRRN